MGKSKAKQRARSGAKSSANAPIAPAKRESKSPKSMVIRMGAGAVGKSISQLALDVRQVLEPGTASRLQERKSNRLKDFTVMAGPLGVTHLLLFSKSKADNTNMRLALSPRGPTLSFRIENYSLCKDILKAQRHPKGNKALFLNSPLIVMNNFKTIPDDAKETNLQSQRRTENLVAECFRSLFPPVSPESTQLGSVKRILLLNREVPTDGDSSSFHITLRHYSVSTKNVGVPRAIRRLNAAERAKTKAKRGKGVPNLGKLNDVADYMLDQEAGNYTSASESEPETDAEVEVLARQSKKLHYRAKLEKLRAANGGALPRNGDEESHVEKRGLVLSELGPRIKFKLIKIEEGLCEGKVIWHDFLSKTREEEKEMDATWEKRKAEKEERRRVQRENVERKRKEKESQRAQSGRAEDGEEDEDEEMDDYDDYWEDDLDDPEPEQMEIEAA